MSVKDLYNEKLMTINEMVLCFKSGWICFSDVALAVPTQLFNAIENDRSNQITFHTMLDLEMLSCYDLKKIEKPHGVSWFSGRSARKAIAQGKADYMLANYSDMPRLIEEHISVDAFCAVVSPMDENGFFSTGCSASNSAALLKKAKHVYIEVNENMPRTLTAPMIHISQVNGLYESNKPLTVLPESAPDIISNTIGGMIAEEIPNGATIQLGIGQIPNAIGLALKSKRNLGIHTEMFTDSMLALIESGAVDNSLKPIHYGKSVTTFCLGSKKMYDYVHDNPAIEFLPVDYVNNPTNIARHNHFISVNTGLEVDFYGQVSSESLGFNHISGTGGQADFVRGAVLSRGGKSFIAFPSTAKNETISKINPMLTMGSPVTTHKNDVDHIVTEYGVAKLRGRTISQRTKALINIAHPKFREKLTHDAKRLGIII